jgi:ABC-type nitrate/sulfonate/bicarbonate transport system substrate-binding protein
MARPEIKQPSDLRGKKAGITTFGSTSDQILRIALKQFNLEPNQDVAILTLGAQPEAFAALQSGAVHVVALSYPLYPKAAKIGMRELVNFGQLARGRYQRHGDHDAILHRAAARHRATFSPGFHARYAPLSDG